MSQLVAAERSLPASLEEVAAWGKVAKEAGILPANISPLQALVIVQAGREIGLQPLQALRTISLINGRLVMSVQLQLALARKHAGVVIQSKKEDANSCTVTLRRGEETVTCTYTLEDAKRAGLLKEGGNWARYPRQMLFWRACGDALRQIAPDIVLGFLSPEEALTLPPVDDEDLQPVSVPVAPDASNAEQQVTVEAAPAKSDAASRAKELNRRLEELGFNTPERVALKAAIREAHAAGRLETEPAYKLIEEATDRETLLAGLREMGVRFPPSPA